jgi:hypothetical protein
MVLPEPALAPVIPPVMVPIVQENVLAVLAVKLMFGLFPLHTVAMFAVVTTGVGFTVTVIVKAFPTQEPVVEVGVTRYWTVPAAELLGLVSTWLIVVPELALAPVIPPVMAPIVHANVLGVLAVNVIFGDVPLQVLAVAAFVTTGLGFTVTVIVKAAPAHEPVVDVGVTRYWTVPVAELLGLVSTWLIVDPEPALAPVIPPVMIPIVQEKVLGVLAVNPIFGPVPLQVIAVAAFVTEGAGFTVTVIV